MEYLFLKYDNPNPSFFFIKKSHFQPALGTDNRFNKKKWLTHILPQNPSHAVFITTLSTGTRGNVA